uniref:Uncharacterized protein n=2 Tax=Norzivirales TaxID=2842247 RepID=A0A514D897_9VIRU|nr:MAG: hypothetical protein H1BulkLitter4270_000004 [Leviviridae sp.]
MYSLSGIPLNLKVHHVEFHIPSSPNEAVTCTLHFPSPVGDRLVVLSYTERCFLYRILSQSLRRSYV